MKAADEGCLSVVDTLLNRNAQVDQCCDVSKRFILHAACSSTSRLSTCLAYNLIHDFDLKYIDGTIVLLAAVRILSADYGLRERICLRGSFVAQTPCAG